MWASEKARNDAIRKMLGPVRARRWWTEDGPSRDGLDAMEGIKRMRSPLSHGEQVLLRAAFDLFNGTGNCRVDDMAATLDEDNLRLVCEAILARDRT